MMTSSQITPKQTLSKDCPPSQITRKQKLTKEIAPNQSLLALRTKHMVNTQKLKLAVLTSVGLHKQAGATR